MPNFEVFSLVEVAGEVGSQELWKYRANIMADNAYEAINQVAETDAPQNPAGKVTEYAACRASCWERRPMKFSIKPEFDRTALDNAEEPAKV